VTDDAAAAAAGAASTSKALDSWLDSLAEADGAPGGGAACGVMLGVSAALLHMVALYTDDQRAAESATRLVVLREAALRAAERDSERSAALGAALARPSHESGRDLAVREAALAGGESSSALGEVAEALVPELELLADIGNPNITADLVVAAHALVAGVAGALVNLRGDVRLAGAHGAQDEDATAEEPLHRSARSMAEARDAASRIAAALAERVQEQ
jgi:formiminotetrahydrofolate cyclodeaminase